MSPFLVALCYGSALVFALVLLWYFGAKHWYWHLLSVLLAFGLGFTPLPETWNSPGMTLLVGWVFVSLFIWGVAAIPFAALHWQPHYGHRAK